MAEVTGPVIATTLVLMAVFVPASFLPGITGRMYRQFALTIAATALISAINALTLKPAHRWWKATFSATNCRQADLYAVGQILHDWTDEKVAQLVGRIADRLPPGGGLLIVEKLLNADGVGPVAANMQSLNMLVVTEGKERTAAGYTRLLHAAGFRQIEARRTGARLDALLAEK